MRRRALTLLTGGAVLLAALGAWWLHGSGSGAADAEGAARALRAASTDARFRGAADPAAAAPRPLDAAEIASAPPAEITTALPGASEAPPETTATMTGRVVDATGAALAGATVVYWPTSSSLELYGLESDSWGAALDVLPRTVTDGGGWFTLDGRVLDTPFPEMTPMELRVAVLAGELAPRSREALGPPGLPIDLGSLALEPGGWLTGRVLDAQRRPVAGAVVAARAPRPEPRQLAMLPGDLNFAEAAGPFASVATGADGRFRAGPLWNGSVSLKIEAEGLHARWLREERVRAGETRDVGDVQLGRAAALTGRVLDARGAPLVGAHVVASAGGNPHTFLDALRLAGYDETAVEAEWAGSQEGVLTDAEGRFEVGELPVANHRLYVAAEGFEPQRVADLEPGGPPVTVVLEREATLRLTIVDAASRKPVADARVAAVREDGRPDSHGVPRKVLPGDGPGRFVVAGVSALPVPVTVTAPGHAETHVVLPGLAPPGSAEHVVELPRDSVVSGRITDAAGSPLAGVTVRCRLPPEPTVRGSSLTLPTASALTDAQGRYALQGLAAGSYTLTASGPGHAPVVQAIVLAPETPLEGLDFVLPLTPTLRGTVRLADGTPAPRRQIHIQRFTADGESQEGRQTETSADGRFEIRELAPGTWRMHGPVRQELTLAAGEQRVLDLQLPAPSGIAGRVVDADGAPVPGALVFVVNRQQEGYSHWPDVKVCDADGRFRVECDPGVVSVVAAGSSGGFSAPAEVVVAAQRIAVVELRFGSAGAEVRLREAGTGAPVSGVHVALVPLLADDQPALELRFQYDDWRVDLSVFTDAQGVAVFPRLGPGRYELRVEGDALLPAPYPPVSVAEGQPTRLDVEVVRPAAVRGVVRRASGVLAPDGVFVQLLGGPDGQQPLATLAVGQFDLKGVAPGEWRLLVSESFLYEGEPLPPEYVLADRTIVLASGQVLDLDVIADR